MSVPDSKKLFSAIMNGDLTGVKAEVEAGVDPNVSRSDIYPLLLAVREKRDDIAKYLIEEADASIDEPNNFGWTALMEATRSGQLDMIKFMDQYEIRLKVTTSHGDGLIHAAVQGNTSGIVSYFADRVKVDLPNKHGVTPVMLAAEKQAEASFRELVDLGADLDRKDSAGNSARDRLATWKEGRAIVVAAQVTESPAAPPVAPVVTVPVEATPSPVAARPGLSRITKRPTAVR